MEMFVSISYKYYNNNISFIYSAISSSKPMARDYIDIDKILRFLCCVKIISNSHVNYKVKIWSSHVKITMTSSQPGINFDCYSLLLDIYRSCHGFF